MLGLFVNTYDYHEWSDLVCVSESEGALVKYHKENCSDYELLPSANRDALREEERCHYAIETIKVAR